MCCGGNCTGNCGGNGGGNFTYVRYASDSQGTNISKYIDKDNSGNIDGITRCYQSIFVSPIELDVNSALFPTHFTEWTYGCEEDCGCGGCEWYDYHRTELGNRWTWNNGVFTNDSILAFQNDAEGVNNYNGDIMTIPFFKDSDGNLLQSGLNYCFELKFDPSLFTNPNSSVEISFGNGTGATIISYNQSDISGLIKATVTAVNGTVSSHTMVIRLVNSLSPSGTEVIDFRIFNFRLAPESCCEDGDCGCNCDITMKPLELILGEEINFTHTDYGSEVDAIEPGQTEINRGTSQSIFNSAVELGYQLGSPANTEWNSVFTDPVKNGFGNLFDIKSRVYSDFVTALNNAVGLNILGLELIMHDLSTDKYHKFLFSSWTQGANGGGFAYTRQEVDVTEPCKITFSDGTVQSTAAGNVIGGTNVTVQEVIIGGERTFIVNAAGGGVNYSDVAFVDLYNGSDATGLAGDFTKPFQSISAAQSAVTGSASSLNPGLVVLRKGLYTSSINLITDVHIYCEPGVVIYFGQINASNILIGQYTKFYGFAHFQSQSWIFNMSSDGEVDLEFDSADCAGMLNLNFTPIVRVKFNRARLSGMNGGGYGFRITDRCDVTVTAREYIYSQHVMFFLRNGSVQPFAGRLVVHSPRLWVLPAYTSTYGNIYKCVLTTGPAGACYVELNCPDIRIVHSGGVSGDYRGLINLVNQYTAQTKIVINGNLYGNDQNCILTGYVGWYVNLKVNGDLISNTSPINTYLGNTAGTPYDSNIDINNGRIQGYANILGVSRKHTFKNCSFYNYADGVTYPTAPNISWQNDQPTLSKNAQFYNCLGEANGASSEFMENAAPPSLITLVGSYGNKPLGATAVPDFSDYQVISSLTVPKE
jgi:hypothetical protein